MPDITSTHVFWALLLGAVSAVSLPLGSLIGLNVRFSSRTIAIFAAFGAGALIAALSVELVAPTAFALTEANAKVNEHAFANFMALLIGGVLGGLLFVVLDAVINQQGGYLRKTSTTLAHIAKRRRESVRQMMKAVLEVRPFDALSPELADTVAQLLRPKEFKKDQVILGPGQELAAYIVLEGEVDVEISSKLSKALGRERCSVC